MHRCTCLHVHMHTRCTQSTYICNKNYYNRMNLDINLLDRHACTDAHVYMYTCTHTHTMHTKHNKNYYNSRIWILIFWIGMHVRTQCTHMCTHKIYTEHTHAHTHVNVYKLIYYNNHILSLDIANEILYRTCNSALFIIIIYF